MRWNKIFIFVLSIFFICLASASFSYSESGSNITTKYEPSDYLIANINISFSNESLDSSFIDTFGNTIKLGVLLGMVPEYEYVFYNIANISINSTPQILKFGEANFKMPSATGNFNYQLNLSGKIIFQKEIQISSTNTLIEDGLNEKYSQLNATKTAIKGYDLFVQKILNEFLNISFIEDNLQDLELDYENADTSQEYTEILGNLSSIKIPIGISESVNTNSITFYPKREKINLEILKAITGGDYAEDEEGYIDAIYIWNEGNLTTDVTFREMLIDYGTGGGTNLKIFMFEFDKNKMQNEAYFIIEDIGDLNFEDIEPVEESGYLYINLADVSNKIIFSTTEEVNFLDIPVFISPSLTVLHPVIVEPPPRWDQKKFSKWILFGLIIFLLLLIGTVTYIALQIWYRKKYENYLFKNRNNLYNIMTYIQTAKKKGMPKEEIIKHLKKAGWTREQINYALQKYEGKKIAGIIERPFKKVIESVEKKPSQSHNTKV